MNARPDPEEAAAAATPPAADAPTADEADDTPGETDDTPTGETGDTPTLAGGTAGSVVRAREEVPAVAVGDEDGEVLPRPWEREWPRGWMREFLRSLSALDSVDAAARFSRVGRSTAYRYREALPEFAEAWEESRQIQRDNYLRHIYQWTTTGLPVEEVKEEEEWVRGEDGGMVLVKRRSWTTRRSLRSERLAELWLRSWYPDRFKRVERLEQTGPDGGPIEVVATREEVDAAAERFSAAVVRLADRRAAREGAGGGAAGE